MSDQLIVLFMFLLLTYLLFRRPASAVPGQHPTELDFQIGQWAITPRKKSVSTEKRSNAGQSVLKTFVLGLAVALPATAIAQVTATADQTPQTQLAVTANHPKTAAEEKKEGSTARDKKDNEALLEEMRQMRQLIEQLGARVNQLETEKSAALAKAG